jgi:DNA-binding beta-propeller fold protein YncE/cytochrome c
MKCFTTLSLGLVLFAQSSVTVAGTANSLMDISNDGRLLACSNRDSGTVSIVSLVTHKKLREISVGHHPEGVSFIGSSHILAVAVYDDDNITFLDADSGSKTGRVDVFDEPYGVVSNPAGTKVYVTLDYPGMVIEIDAKTRKINRRFEGGKFLRGLAISADGGRLYTTDYFSTLIRAIDVETMKQVDQWAGISSDNLSRQFVLNPRRPKAYLAHIRSRITVNHGTGSVVPYVTVVDTNTGEGQRRARIPMDAFSATRVTANPWEIAIASDGRQLYVVFGGTDDMYACNVIDDDYEELSPRRYLRVGRNPRAVRVAPDNKTVYVYNALDFQVVGFSTLNLNRVVRINICDNPLGEQVHRGKILFYSALQPMVGRRWISCSSCHPDGQADGRTWKNPEGLRNTQSFAGIAWTHPIHWSADRDEVQDFEHTIRGKLMQGRGLHRGQLNKSLGPANRGLSRDLDALAAYTNTHKFTLSPYGKSGLSESAKRGQAIFASKNTRCIKCHRGPFYTDSVPGPAKKIVRHDVGTGKDDPGELMGPAYDTPTLLGLYRTAPYLHHGKAATLVDVLTKNNPNDKHGSTSHLSEQDVNDLAEFLKALPFQDPEVEARRLGMTKVID